ncbi:hypothetical protein SAMN05518801_10271 [Novosphingobium sp. CF614]|uniref:hypothetical protein n=1 Tax=Novosphingobium sp. CF614 TaxID=1884364 RepID=UPI0008E36921|nr:hypothetical protein [Novosphingobium sp. CF614]SFF83283.1 hypothetical protein SAMN05518801_10271 [Novosphingobium sp. CF614]
MSENKGPKLPGIDRTALPDLDVLTGVFGSLNDVRRRDADDDNHAELMPCLYPFVFPD